MSAPNQVKWTREREDGWLDAYARRPKSSSASKEYREGYRAGARERKATDARMAVAEGVQRA